MSRFLNPTLSETERLRVETENWVALAAVQASVGLIGPEVRGVSVQLTAAGKVQLHIAVDEHSDSVREDINDLLGNLEADLGTDFEIEKARIHVGATDPSWSGRADRSRLLYLRNSR